MSNQYYYSQGGGGIKPFPHMAIAPPFDPNDEYGDVHTTLPPEQVIPPRFTDPTFMRADFNGVTLDLRRWDKQTLPFLKGANSTPLSMLMTPMLMMYPRYWQDACLTEHAERGYDDFIISTNPWNAEENGFSYSPESIRDWASYIKSWGFRVVLWQAGRPPFGLGDTARLLLNSGLLSFYIHGKEVNSQMSSEDFEASLQEADREISGYIPIGAHFSPDGARKMGYPQCAPHYMRDWSIYNGRVHLMQQLAADGREPNTLCPAGLQGASMYYGRKRVYLGIDAGEGGLGPGAPDSKVIAFETMAIEQLYGRCNEEYGCLRTWELLCGTRNNDRVKPVHGFGNGGRYPNGDPI